jgi:hypothetical protein
MDELRNLGKARERQVAQKLMTTIRCLQTGEDSFSYVLLHNAAIFVSNDGRSIHF